MMNKAGYDIGFDVGGSHIAGALFSGERSLCACKRPILRTSRTRQAA